MKGHDSFHAAHNSRCRGCKGPIRRGENVWSPGKKGKLRTGTTAGMYHIACRPEVTVYQMTDEQLASARARMNRLKLSRGGG